MISSPNEKGVVVIGGKKCNETSNALIELSGDCKDDLKWTILDQKLQSPRVHHLAFPIGNKILRDLSDTYDIQAN